MRENLDSWTQATYELVLLLAINMKQKYYRYATSFMALYKGGKASLRGIRWKRSATEYEAKLVPNTWQLHNRLQNDSYTISPYLQFNIHEPKERIIYAPALVDRQLQHALCDNGLYQDLTEHFIRDNMACQRGRGTDDALSRMKVHLQRYYRKHGADGWFLKCDIHKYFPSIDHAIAKEVAAKYISDPDAYKQVCRIIDSFDGDVGLGLGSQISQLIGITLLDGLDHFIKERLHIKYYIRYMDDFILVHKSKEYLTYCKREINAYLSRLKLTFNPKTGIQPLKNGIVFLKWHYYIKPGGRVVMLLQHEKLSREKKRLRKIYQRELAGTVPQGAAAANLCSFLVNAQRGNSNLIQYKITTFYKEMILHVN